MSAPEPRTDGRAVVVTDKGVAHLPDGRRTFTEGNTAAVTHGARSSHLLEWAAPAADALAVQMVEEAPHLAPEDRHAVRGWAIAEVIVQHLTTWIEQHGPLDEDGHPRKVLDSLRMWLARAEVARARLGLDPAARVALAVDELHARRQAAALADVDRAEGTRLRTEAEARRKGEQT